MKPAQTCLTSEMLQRLQVDDLAPLELRDIEEHLNGCERCCERLEDVAPDVVWQQIAEVLRSTTTVPPLEELNEEHSLEDALKLLGPTDDPEKLGRIGTYEVVGIVGRGGMGVVYKAFEPSLSRFVAIKMLLPHLAASGPARRRFTREGQAAAAVVDDHVLPIYGVADWQGIPYLVMQFLNGTTLEKRVRDHGPLEVREVLRIGMQTARGLAAAHAQGLVHRDVKPSNILLDGTVDRAMLMDFGLARAVDDASITGTGVIAGTPQYMSPEQALGRTVDARSDLFSLGCVLYFMCTGRSPFRAENSYAILKLIIDQQPRHMQEMNPELPDWLCTLVSHLMAKEPGERPATAQDVAHLLEQCLAHLQQPGGVHLPESLNHTFESKSVPQRVDRFRRRLFAVLAISALIVVSLTLMSRRGPSLNTTNTRAEQRAVAAVPKSNVIENSPFQKFDSHAVCDAACRTWRDYVQWWNQTKGVPLTPIREIPRSLWADDLIRLNPQYVYTHGVNLVIVRSCEGANEEGIYVVPMIASARGPDDEQFTRTLIANAAGGAVFTFRRQGHLDRASDQQSSP